MKIHINKQSEQPVREQLREQIIFLLGTGNLPVGSTLPSLRHFFVAPNRSANKANRQSIKPAIFTV